MSKMIKVPVKKEPVLMSIPDGLALHLGLDPKHGTAIHNSLVRALGLSQQGET